MIKTIFLFLLMAISNLSLKAQQPLRRFLQPKEIINSTSYGNNPKAGNYVWVKDAKIYYEVYGKGKPILLLHGGLFGSTIEFAELIDQLKTRFQVIAVTTRGHGRSELGKDSMDLDQRATDAITVINKVTTEKVMVIGFSDGGYTAYKLASLYPDRIDRMVVIGAGILYPGLRSFQFDMNKVYEADPNYWDQQKQLMPEPQRWAETFKQIANFYSNATIGKELLNSIQCSVLVMAGDRDEGNSVNNVLSAALMIPNHQLSIIPNTGHTTLNENFTAAWAGMKRFLGMN